MAIVKVYERIDGSEDGEVCGSLDTNICFFKNPTEPGIYEFDKDQYPYIKIANGSTIKYYKNDGLSWDMNNINCAAISTIAELYIETWNNKTYYPLKKNSSVGVETNSNSPECNIVGNMNSFGVVTLKNYKFNNKKIQSTAYVKNQSEINKINNKKDLPYQNSDQQKMLPFNESFIKNRYYWDFTPKEENFFIFSNFNEDSNSTKNYKIEVKNNVVSLYERSFAFNPWQNVSNWDLKLTPYMVFCFKIPSQTNNNKSNKLGIPTIGRNLTFGSHGLESNKVSACLGSGERPSLNIVGPDFLYDSYDKPLYKIELKNEIRFIPIKLYNGTEVIIHSTEIVINKKTYNPDYLENNIKNYEMFSDYFIGQKVDLYKKVFLWNDNTLGYKNLNTSDGYFSALDSAWRGGGITGGSSFQGYDVEITLNDYCLINDFYSYDEEDVLDMEYMNDQIIFKKSEHNFYDEDIYINNRKTSEGIFDDKEYGSTHVNLAKWHYNIDFNNKEKNWCFRKKGAIPSFINLLRSPHSYLDPDTNKEESAWTNFGVGLLKHENNEYGDFEEYPYVWWKYNMYDKGKSQTYVCALSMGISSDPSYGITILGTENETNLFKEFSKNTCVDRTINSSSGNYIFTSNYGKKIKVICNLNDNSTREFYILPYATISTQLKEDSVADWDCEVVNED